MEKLVYWSIGIFVSIVLLIILVFGSYGDKLQVQQIDVLTDTLMSEETATCEKHYNEVLSTKSMYDTFVDDCLVTKDLGYDTDYFLQNVLIVSNFTGDEDKTPKSFFDYYFSVNGKETIKVTYHNKLFSSSNEVWQWYFIELEREQIATKNVVVG